MYGSIGKIGIQEVFIGAIELTFFLTVVIYLIRQKVIDHFE